jgi:hypothetical protein
MEGQKHEPQTISSLLFMWTYTKLIQFQYIYDIRMQYSLNRHRAKNMTDQVRSIGNSSGLYSQGAWFESRQGRRLAQVQISAPSPGKCRHSTIASYHIQFISLIMLPSDAL